MGVGVIYVIVMLLTRKQLARESLKISQSASKVVKILQEGLGGIRDIILDGTQDAYTSTYRNIDVELRNAQTKIQIVSVAPKYIIETIGIIVISVLAYCLSLQPEGFASAVPVLGALAIGAQKLLPTLQQGYSSWALMQGARESLRDVLDLLEQPVPEKSSGEPVTICFQREICLKNISFRYAGRAPYVLKNLNLSLIKGGRIGIIGETGSGKSTMLDMLMGLLQPTSGEILVDGISINTENCSSWQRHIAHVPQAIFLTDATICENIAFGVSREKIDFTRVTSAARRAQIADSIESWSEGYDTMVGERGVKLSGGQRQRIGIARALYKEADVIIFDEATSALDNDTERAVMESIDSLGDGLTILIIAHRLSTLKNCTQIVELQNGQVARVGNYADLVENCVPS
jgi:ABC-type multidrug transport system fused ATPase/permease subunit